jgi:hypothetical protein
MKHDTPHRPDDELDDLFRRAAGAYEPPFDPKAWKQMQQKLDGGTRPLVRRLYLFGLVELLFVLAVLVLAWNETGTAADRSAATAVVVGTDGRNASPTNGPDPVRSSAASPKGTRSEPESEATVSSRVTRRALPDEATESFAGKAVTRPLANAEPNVAAGPDRGTAEQATRSNRTTRPTEVPDAPTAVRTDVGATGSARTALRRRTPSKPVPSTDLARSEPSFSGARTPATRRNRPNLWRTSEGPERRRARRETDAAAVPPVLVSTEPLQSISVDQLKLRAFRWSRFAGTPPAITAPAVPPRVDPVRPPLARWSGLVFASPDFTNVPGRAVGATGYNLGAQLEFRFLRRLRVGLGANYATKLYDASSYDYVPYPGIWQRYGRPDVIAADCRILELPLSLRYDVFQGERSAWSVSLGSSSYLMLNEEYRYQFAGGREYPHTEKRSGNHWLATLNVSVAYERMLARRLALRVEPTLKLPQGGVGYGHVRLRTAGVALGLRYDFPRR